MELVVPPRLDERTITRVQELAVAAFVASDCEGMARVDFFVRENGEVVVNELNTIPGFTATSVYAKALRSIGDPVRELLERLVDSSRARAPRPPRRLKY
jgi:D-alanine-D-alanine ligase